MIVTIVWTAVAWYGARAAERSTSRSVPSTRQVGIVGGGILAGVLSCRWWWSLRRPIIRGASR